MCYYIRVKRNKERVMADTFTNDTDKMIDLLEAIMAEDNMQAYDDFLTMYPDVTENELDDTVKEINGISLAYLARRIENANIEELNGRETGLKYSAESMKTTLSNYVYNTDYLTKAERQDFEDECEGMAV